MATKLVLPQGASRSYLLTFLRPDGDPEDLTGAIFAAFIKRSIIDADADALVDLSAQLVALDPEAGTAVLTLAPSATADLATFEPREWQARAILADDRLIALDAHKGPLVFAPMTGDPSIAEPPNDYIAEYSAGLPGDGSAYAAITGLTGGTAADLDGLSAARLAGLPDGSFITLFLAGSISARYRIRARAPADEAEVGAAAGGFKIIADLAPTRIWELVAVTKQGVPCVWNPDTVKWHQQLAQGVGAGVAPALAQEADAFSLPA